jgi:hypothetical protein
MTTNKGNAMSAKLGQLARCASFLLACGGLASVPAHATTDGETALANSPLPHERLGTGRDSVQVHWVRLRGYFEGTKGHAAMMDELKSDVRNCVQMAQRDGRQTRPPQAWPDYVMVLQRDSYDASNRSISYGTTLLYTVNPSDCNLVENRTTVAQVTSTKGICQIDLATRKAHGACDANTHANAPPLVRSPGLAPGPGAVPSSMASLAAQAALEQAQKLAPGKTGERKTILGIQCDVWRNLLDPTGTGCLSLGGSFVAAHATFGLTGSSMELEMTSKIGANMRAVKAELDAKVNAAVFAPYLADGFQVTNVGGRK